MPIHPFVYIDLSAKDPDASGKFYANLCGWKINVDEHGYHEFVTGGPLDGALIKIDDNRYHPGDIVPYIGADDIAAMLKKVTGLGGKILLPKTDIPTVGAFAFFADLTGNRIGLFEDRRPRHEAKNSIPNHPFIHIDLSAQDPSASSKFYADLCGWKIEANEEYQYYQFSARDANVSGGFVKADNKKYKSGDILPHISANDVDATLEKVTALGGKILLPKTDIPPIGAYAYFADPAGNRIALFDDRRTP